MHEEGGNVDDTQPAVKTPVCSRFPHEAFALIPPSHYHYGHYTSETPIRCGYRSLPQPDDAPEVPVREEAFFFESL